MTISDITDYHISIIVTTPQETFIISCDITLPVYCGSVEIMILVSAEYSSVNCSQLCSKNDS